MRIEKIQATPDIAAPAAHISNAKVSAGAEVAAIKSAGDVGNAAIRGFNLYVQQRQVAEVMEANNYYNRLMSDEMAKLTQKKEGAALNIVDEYDAASKKVREQVDKEYGKYLWGEQGRALVSSINRDDIAKRNRMVGYQQAETEKYQATQYNNMLNDICKDVANSYDMKSIEYNVNKAGIGAEAYYFNRGEERVKAGKNEAISRVVLTAINAANANGDYDNASVMGAVYERYLTPEQRIALDRTIRERRERNYRYSTAQKLYGETGGSLAEIQRRLQGGKSFGVDSAMAFAQKLKDSGVRYQLGGNGTDSSDCGKFVQDFAANGGVTLDDRTADGQLYQMEKEGKFTKNRAEAGDYALVFWRVKDSPWEYSDDPNCDENHAYKGVTHVGVMMPDGKVLQMGNSGLTEIPEDTYEVYGYGRLEGNAYSPEEQRQIMSQAMALDNQNKAIKRQQISFMIDDYGKQIAQMIAGGERPTSALNQLLNSTNDPDAHRAITNAYKLGGYGGSGSSKARMTFDMENYIRTELLSGNVENESQVLDFLQQQGIDNKSDLEKGRKLFKDWMEGKGEFAFNISDLVKDSIPDSVKGAARRQLQNGLKEAARLYIMDYRKKNNGENPDDGKVIEAINNAKVARPRGGKENPGSWFSSELEVADYELYRIGAVRMELVEGTDNTYRLYLENGKTEEITVDKLLRRLNRE